jgi:hypothetical protein
MPARLALRNLPNNTQERVMSLTKCENILNRVKELHKPVDLSICSTGCCEPWVLCDECNLKYPCETIKILDTENDYKNF